jgi:hypothetical protein
MYNTSAVDPPMRTGVGMLVVYVALSVFGVFIVYKCCRGKRQTASARFYLFNG